MRELTTQEVSHGVTGELMNLAISARHRTKVAIRSTGVTNCAEMAKLAEEYDAVSFDVFDTLIKRNVMNPPDVFSAMEKAYCSLPGNFRALRVKAEQFARSLSNSGEVTLCGIYACLGYLLNDAVDERVLASWMQLELEMELNLVVAHQPMVDLFHMFRRNGKRLVLISDSYFSSDFISRLLEACGVFGWHALFVSCEMGVSKRSGRLFDAVISDFGCLRSDLIHFGDSPIEDKIRPLMKGIATVRIPTYWNNLKFRKLLMDSSLEDSCNLAFLNGSVGNRMGYNRFGYEILGPLLQGFCAWLHKNALQDDINKIVFFSRDGYIIQKAYKLLYGNEAIANVYMYVSRQSFRTATLWMQDFIGQLADIVQDDHAMTLSMLLDNLGLDAEKYKEIASYHGLALDDKLVRTEMGADRNLKSLLTSIEMDIRENSRQQYSLLVKYAKSLGLNGRFGVVDIGWRGSLQKNLNEILQTAGIEAEVMGYYVGLRNNLCKLSAKGYLFDCNTNASEGRRQSSYLGPTEVMFFGNEGSTRSYGDNDGRVVVKCYPYEYESLPWCREVISEIQDGALEYIIDYKKACPYPDCNVSSNLAFIGLRQALEIPNKQVLNMFANLPFFDGEERRLIDDSLSLLDISNNLQGSLENFRKSRWKSGQLKEIIKSNMLVFCMLRIMYSTRLPRL